PSELLHILKKSLEKDPDDRYQSMSEIIVDLRRLKKESTRIVRTQEYHPHKEMQAPTAAPALSNKFVSKRNLIGSGIVLFMIIAGFVFKDAILCTFAAKNDKKIIVVLPFENLGPADKDYFVDGMSDEVTSRLSGLSGLSVIARSSATQYKKTTKSIKQIGEELGVSYILQGTVRWEMIDGETHVRVNPTLIKVDDGTQVWSQSMESILSSAFKLQSDIASRVAGAMDVALAKTEKTSLETSLTENSEAYDYYLQAIQYSDRTVSKSDFEIAVQLFERAIQFDPSFAAAYAKLSYVHSNMYWFFYDHTESRIEKSRSAAEKAMTLAPELSEAHEAMGWFYYHAKLDYKSALEEFSLALKYRPSNSNVHYGIAAVLRRQGDMAGSVESFKKSIVGNPRASDLVRQLGETQTLLRDYEEADRNYTKAIDLTPDVTAVYWEKAKNILLWKGDIGEARRIVGESRRQAKDSGAEYFLTAMTYEVELLAGNYEGAKAALDRDSGEVIVNDQFLYAPTSLLRAQLESMHGNAAAAVSYYENARIELEREQKAHPADERLYSAIGIAYAGLGRREDAVRAGKHGVDLLPVEKEAWRGSYRLADLARIYAMTGDQDLAVDALEHLLSIPCEVSATFLKIDPRWISLRENKKFQTLVNNHL
ncbi:MAG: hypothetical protein WBZ48_12345, partial [Bacteroidota bacterium]